VQKKAADLDLLHLRTKINAEAALFKKLYPLGIDSNIRQGQIGVCYLLTAINAIRKTSPEVFKQMVAQNIKEVGPDLWEVTIPGAKHPGPYRVKRTGSDEWTPAGVVRSAEAWEKYHSKTNAPLGDIILELAYASSRSMEIHDARGGTILKDKQGGYPVEGGYGEEAVAHLLGKGLALKPISISAKSALSSLEYSADNPGRRILTAGTPRIRGEIVVEGHKLVGPHAYAIIAYDKVRQLVTLENPHDTSKPFQLSVEAFQNNFEVLSFVILAPQASPLSQTIARLREIQSEIVMKQVLTERLSGGDLFALLGVRNGDVAGLGMAMRSLVDLETNPTLSAVLLDELQRLAPGFNSLLPASLEAHASPLGKALEGWRSLSNETAITDAIHREFANANVYDLLGVQRGDNQQLIVAMRTLIRSEANDRIRAALSEEFTAMEKSVGLVLRPAA
jgi:hypothetical protein